MAIIEDAPETAEEWIDMDGEDFPEGVEVSGSVNLNSADTSGTTHRCTRTTSRAAEQDSTCVSLDCTLRDVSISTIGGQDKVAVGCPRYAMVERFTNFTGRPCADDGRVLG